MSISTTSADLALRAEIEELVTRYATAIDHRDWELFRSVFTDSAHIDYGPLMGSWDDADEFTGFMKAAHAPAGRSIHRMTNVVVTTVDPITATTYGDSLILDGSDESTGDHGAAKYIDEFERTADGLRISRRTTEVVVYEKVSGNLAV